MNTGNEYSDIVQKINKGNVVDGREDLIDDLKHFLPTHSINKMITNFYYL